MKQPRSHKILTTALGAALTFATGAALASETYGLGGQGEFIPAYEFTPLFGGGTCTLEYFAWHYYFRPAGCLQSQYIAELDLPEGARMSEMYVMYVDNSTSDVSATLRKSYVPLANTATGASWDHIVGSTATSSGQGPNYNFALTSGFAETYDSYVSSGGLQQDYSILVNLPDASSNLRFKGVWLFWQRQIAPAPVAASFSDVPTTHPFFNEVQQLVKSGITVGCGGGQYCPDAPVTRGQMAAFLSRALGLHWNYSTDA